MHQQQYYNNNYGGSPPLNQQNMPLPQHLRGSTNPNQILPQQRTNGAGAISLSQINNMY